MIAKKNEIDLASMLRHKCDETYDPNPTDEDGLNEAHNAMVHDEAPLERLMVCVARWIRKGA